MTDPDGLRDIQQAADWLNVKYSWLRDQVTAGTVPHTRLGRQIRFTREHLAAIVAAGERRPVQTPSLRLVLPSSPRKRRTA